MSLLENWGLQIDPLVFKFLRKIQAHDAKAVLEVIRSLPDNPFWGDIQKMKDREDTWRRRVGAFRIFYKLDIGRKVILVFHVERRTSKTY